MLPYGTGVCRYAFIYYFKLFIASFLFFFYTEKKSGIDKSTEWSTIPAYPSLMFFLFFFLNRGNTEGTYSSNKFCLVFVYVFCTSVSGLILLFLDNLWFDDLRAG